VTPVVSQADLSAWLSRYGAAWESRDAELAAALFSADATYRETPFDPPMTGRDGVRDYWRRVTADQRDVAFSSRAIAVNGRHGVAEWSARFRLESSGARLELDGVFVLEFDEAGLCTSLREWWHVRPAPG
jgi:ketosteroid isomerase-like protein